MHGIKQDYQYPPLDENLL